MKEVKIYTIVSDQLSPPITGESFCTDMVRHSDYAELEAKCAALVAENAVKQEFIKTCFRAAADGVSMDGADIQEIGERLGLFGRETYQPVLHGYICGREAGEDTVYVMKKTPAAGAFLAEVRASGVEMAITHIEQTISPNHETVLNEYAAKIRKGVQS
ncbi:hypothetical protein F0D32_06585 [Salmonella enterica subsp. enterica]|nr:hypothetical protein [Salmonella enterica subsp. enterica serovar Poona]EBG8103505.1 hypothetical protein [Salmonella enterica subsp. enterica serovar Poona]EBG8884392.1 hypothetical protein [Salmonella enterica subsp. enterica serovar Poona]ECD7986685.1 hypothetical protein [Salmonella enterica subsp. enterica serovar Poona]ECK0653437.1 hypothetical protein [Salmonella enterica subsp. enterica serovar Poona]